MTSTKSARGIRMAHNAWLDDVDEVRAIARGVYGVLEAGMCDGLNADAVGYLMRDQSSAMDALDRIESTLYKQRESSRTSDESERP